MSTEQLLPRAINALRDLLYHGTPVPDNQGNPVPYESNPAEAEQVVRDYEAVLSTPAPSPVAGLPTPETDAHTEGKLGEIWVVGRDFARSLERQRDMAIAAERRTQLQMVEDSKALATARAAAADMEEQVKAFEADRASLRAQLTDARAEVADLKGALEIATRSADDQMRQKREAEAQLATAKEELANAQSELSAYCGQFRRQDKTMLCDPGHAALHIVNLQRDNASLRSDLAKANAAVEEAKEVIASWVAYNAAKDQYLTLLRAQLAAQQSVPAEARAVEAAEKIITTGIANGDHPKTIAMKIVSPPKQQETELRTLTPAGIMRWVNESERKLSKDQTKVGAHTSDAPPVCPKCGSADEMIRHGDGQWVCHATHVVERTCFPPGEGEEWAKAAAKEIHETPYDLQAIASGDNGESVTTAIILKHAPGRPTAAREDTELRSLVDRLREEFVKLHTEAISRRDNGLPENWSRYENDRSYYEGVIEEIDAAMQQGGKTP